MLAIAIAGMLAASPAAFATNLMEAWQAAKSHDYDYMAAAAEHESGEALKDQGNALWHPTVTVTGTAGRMNSNTSTSGAQFYGPGLSANGATFNTSINGGNLERWGLSAKQALISGDRSGQSRKLQLAGEARELEWQVARQTLILKTAERYFDVAMAQESLAVARHEAESVQRSLAEVKARFDLGDIPVTDVHEATARMDAIQAEILAAETDLQLKTAVLADATGLDPDTIKTMQPAGALPPPGKGFNEWLDTAMQENPQLRLAEVQAEISREEVRRYGPMADVSVDLVGEVYHDRLGGLGDYGSAENVSNNALVGVQLTVPLSTGGAQSARRSEAAALAEKTRDMKDRTRQQVAEQTRAAWLNVTVGESRATSLEAALKASTARLAATRLGNKVGDRSTLDVLNAENDAASARLSLLQARIALVMNRLRLAALAGQLDDKVLQDISLTLANEPEGINAAIRRIDAH
jgi:outer membrane protein